MKETKMDIKQEFHGEFVRLIDQFETRERDLVTWRRTESGIFVAVALQTGEYRTKAFWTMCFARRFFNKLQDKYTDGTEK